MGRKDFTGDRQLVGSVVLIADSIAYQLDLELFSDQIDVKSGEK